MREPSITAKAIRILPAFPAFMKAYRLLKKSRWWSREQLEEYQLQQLSKLLNHAYENVPYYRRIFDERGLKPNDIQGFTDLWKLPFLTKEIIRANLDDLKARNYPESKFEHAATSGSTGATLSFYREKAVSQAKEEAFIKNLWERVGYKFTDKCAVLRGYIVESADEGKFWERTLFGRWLILSAYHMTDENLPKYIQKIREFKPRFIQAFPSVIIVLARFIKENNIEPFPNVKAILCGSENLYPWQRDLLEAVFQCRVYNWLGHGEQCILAGECEKSNYYHIFPEYGFVELIGEDGNPVTEEDKTGEIVATSFRNFIFPFIRYRTGDLGVYTTQKCICGRNYPLLKRVEGRLQELVVTKDRRLVTLTALIFTDRFEALSRIKEIQLFQEKEGELIINITKGPQYSERDEQEICYGIQKRVGNGLHVTFNYVDHIPRTQSGKYRFLIQKLPVKFGDNQG